MAWEPGGGELGAGAWEGAERRPLTGWRCLVSRGEGTAESMRILFSEDENRYLEGYFEG